MTSASSASAGDDEQESAAVKRVTRLIVLLTTSRQSQSPRPSARVYVKDLVSVGDSERKQASVTHLVSARRIGNDA